MTYTLHHPDNEHQWSVNNFWSSIFGKQGIAQISELSTAPLTTLIGKNIQDYRKNTDSKIFDITNCKSCKTRLLAVEYRILITYYYQTPTTRSLYKSTNGPAGRPDDNPPYSDGLGDFHQTLPKLMDQVY